MITPKTTFIGTFNCRTLRTVDKLNELAYKFSHHGIGLLGVQEHRIVHQETVKRTQAGPGSILLTSTAWRNTMGASVGGVGIMMGTNASDLITETRSVSHRILAVTFAGNPKTTVVSVYAPTEGADYEEAEQFHWELREFIHSVPAHNFLIVLGDMNARLGWEGAASGWYYHRNTSRNGELLRETAEECCLEVANIRFQKKKSRLWTFLSDGTQRKATLDYLLFRKKWRNSVKDAEVSEAFSSLGSDHRLLLAKVKMTFRKRKTPPGKPNLDFAALRTDSELSARFACEVRNRFACLSTDDDEDPTTSYGHFTQAVQETSKSLLGKKKKRVKDVIAEDLRVKRARGELESATTEYHATPSEETRVRVGQAKEDLGNAYVEVEAEEIEKKIRRVEEAAETGKAKEVWRLVNDISGRNARAATQVEGGSPEERKERWFTHFSSLLGSTPTESPAVETLFPPADINTDRFTLDEFRTAKKKIKEGKAFGDDSIPPEVLKRCDLDDIVLGFCNRALEGGGIPDQWQVSNIIPVPKKGDLSKPGNYRGIALTSIVAKTLNRMLLHRIRPYVETRLLDSQNGFREGRSTTSHILTLRRILEGAKAKQLPVAIAFIDFVKAFDSINRSSLVKILRAYGIPDKIVDLIQWLYTNTKAQVLTPDGLTAMFEIAAGVLQGDTLAPYLFIIVLDYCLRIAFGRHPDIGFTLVPARSRRIKASRVTDTGFADDVSLLADSVEKLGILLREVETVCKEVGLVINQNKTELMVENIPDPEPLLTNDNHSIKLTNDFKYLGSWIRDSTNDIKHRKTKAWIACHGLKRVWNSSLSDELKCRLFVATVESVLLYGCETWTLTKQMEKSLNGTYTRMLRMALNKHQWQLRMTNGTLYGFGGLPILSTKIAERRMRLAGHAQRHPELTLHKLILWEPQHGRSKRGRPNKTFVDVLRHDTGLTHTNEIAAVMEDRDNWKRRVLEVREFYPS